jgi:hypothetical protein
MGSIDMLVYDILTLPDAPKTRQMEKSKSRKSEGKPEKNFGKKIVNKIFRNLKKVLL